MCGMNKKLKIGILGCANIAEKYAINAFKAINNAEVVGIASRDPEKAKKWASRFNIRAEQSYDAMIASSGIDAVYIPLPIGLHEEWVIGAASAGKHIICEKSLTDSFDSALKIIESCRSNGVVLYENFMSDFHPQHEKVLASIKSGKIGRPFVFRSNFGFNLSDKHNFRFDKKLGGGSLNDEGAHLVFMARKIFGEEPITVTCNLLHKKADGVDIQGSAMLEFPEARTALLAFSYCSEYQNNYSVWGSQGIINVASAYSIAPRVRPSLSLIKIENYKEVVTDIKVSAVNQFELIFHDFCDTVLNKGKRAKKIASIYKQILAQAKVLEAMRRSSVENRKVVVNEIRD